MLTAVCVCVRVCACVCVLKPVLHYFVSACVVFCEMWVLLRPAGTLIFHHAVCYTTLHCVKVYVYTLSCSLYSSTSPVLMLSHCNYHPPLATHTRAPNQSKELSRLALEKTPYRHSFILTIFRYSLYSPSFFPPSFEFLTSPLNKRCGRPRGEKKVGGRASNEGKEKEGEAEGKRLFLNMLSHLSLKNSTLYAQ